MASTPLGARRQEQRAAALTRNGASAVSRSVSALKEVPAGKSLRNRIREAAQLSCTTLDTDLALSKSRLEALARHLLHDLELPEAYVGWTMVVLFSEYWRQQVLATPYRRRLLLLPGSSSRNLQSALDEIRRHAESLGMPILAADAAEEVLQMMSRGAIDAIVGVADLDTLEGALDRILVAGIPALAVPLLSLDEEADPLDLDWVQSMLGAPATPPTPRSRYPALMQAARSLFEPAELERHLPDSAPELFRSATYGKTPQSLNPLTATQWIAYDFLKRGGKYARPFITLAAYDALSSATASAADNATPGADFPDSVRRVALSIETFHKASLVHDDIEDDDQFRYGQPALHRHFGLSTAINVGDYLIGLGYRLVSREAATLGPEVTGDILDILADAHLRLSAGQGAELIWRDAQDKQLTPAEALRIYALKTSPAFEAALLCGLRCAGPIHDAQSNLRQFCEHLGIAFQILNDLQDWVGDTHNKCGAGLDVLGGRPTLLWSLAITSLPATQREELVQLITSPLDPLERIERVRSLYQEAEVFAHTEQLVLAHRAEAVKIAQAVEPERLSNLLQYLVQAVLQGSAASPSDALTTTSTS